jgi:hypothetical protein
MKKRNTDWEEVGTMGVDAGLCWVGDPCYSISKDASHVWEKWSDFCEELRKQDEQSATQVYCFDSGIAVSTGYGDGEYPVFIKRNKDGRIAAIKVIFIDDEGINLEDDYE